MNEPDNDNTMNLSKFLSSAGVCSRRAAAGLVESGAVRVNGVRAENPGQRVAPEDKVTVNGRNVTLVRDYVYVMLHKPRGYVCTMEDVHAKKKAIDLIPLAQEIRMVSAGRLDKDSEGLILFSNDGDFIARLTHPRYQIRKIYEVSVEGEIAPAAIRALTTDGISDDGEILRAEAVHRIAPGKYEFFLREGKNREIRRMLEYCGKETRRLKRVAVGELRLGTLPLGRWRRLTPEEVQKTFRSGNPVNSRME